MARTDEAEAATHKKDIRSVYISSQTWRELKIEAATDGTTVSAIIREALAQRARRRGAKARRRSP